MADFDWDKDSVEAPVPVYGEGKEQAFDWEGESKSAEEAPGALRSAVVAGARGATKGWSDEIGGLIGRLTGNEAVGKQTKGLMREEQHQVEEEHPVMNFVAGVGGDMASDALVSRLTGLPSGSLPFQMAAGALSGAGDTEKEGLGASLMGAGTGAGLAAATSGLSRLAGRGLGAAKSYIGGKIKGAVDDQVAASARAAEKLANSERGALGGIIAGNRNRIQVWKEILEDPMSSAADKAAAQAKLASPEVRAMIDNVHKNSLSEGAEGLGRAAEQRAAYEAAKAGQSGTAVMANAAEELENPIRKKILPQVLKYGSRILPAVVGSYAGSEIGGTEGNIAGTVLGAGVGIAMGKPGTAISNVMKSPAVRKMGWEAVQKVLVEFPEKLGKFAPALSRALASGPERFAVDFFVLSQQNPEAREMFKKLEDEPAP